MTAADGCFCCGTLSGDGIAGAIFMSLLNGWSSAHFNVVRISTADVDSGPQSASKASGLTEEGPVKHEVRRIEA